VTSSRHTLDVEHRACLMRMAEVRERRDRLAIDRAPAGGGSVADTMAGIRRRQHDLDSRRKMNDLKDCSDEMGYLLSVGKILMKYYDIHGVSHAAEPRTREAPPGSILNYFVPPPTTDEHTQLHLQSRIDASPETKAELMDAYLKIVRSGSGAAAGAPAPEGASCSCCGSTRMVVYTLESMAVCSDCDASEPVLLDNERPPSKDGGKDSMVFAFKRLNHFSEWLAQIQGKENTVVPDDVYASVLAEFKKQQITNMVSVTPTQIRTILKKNGYSKYYEHATSILHHLNGTPAKTIPPALEEKLRAMFRQIQIPFVNSSPPERKNFLSYSYVLHKFVELLGEDQYLAKFRLLKSRDKLYIQDTVWAKICDALGWQFIPSI
jgi:hypothetical protein